MVCVCYVCFVNWQPFGIETDLFSEIYVMLVKKRWGKKKRLKNDITLFGFDAYIEVP